MTVDIMVADGALTALKALRAQGKSNPALKAGELILLLWKNGRELLYARVNAPDPGCAGRYFVELGPELYTTITGEEDLWQFVPDDDKKRAFALLDAAVNVERVVGWMSGGAVVAVTSGASAGLYGAAATTSGLAALGGGSVAAGGFGMAGGLVTIAAVPAALATEALAAVGRCLTSPEDWQTQIGLRAGGYLGGAAGVAGGIGAVAAAGTVTGLSASGITSGIAALGGGAVVAGGGGMSAGIAVICAIAVLPALAVGGATGGIVYAVRQGWLKEQADSFEDTAREAGFQNCTCRRSE